MLGTREIRIRVARRPRIKAPRAPGMHHSVYFSRTTGRMTRPRVIRPRPALQRLERRGLGITR